MERQELENSREFKAAKELEHALNDYGWNNKRFASAVIHSTGPYNRLYSEVWLK